MVFRVGAPHGRAVAATSVAVLLGGLLATGASAQAADSKKVTVKKGQVTITMPAVVNVRAKACVAVPYEYKIDGSVAPQTLSLFVRDKTGQPVAGESIIFPSQVITDLDAIGTEEEKPRSGKGSLRFCGQPQRSTLKFGGPWAAAPNGKQNAQATVNSGAEADLELSVPFQLNVIKRK